MIMSTKTTTGQRNFNPSALYTCLAALCWLFIGNWFKSPPARKLQIDAVVSNGQGQMSHFLENPRLFSLNRRPQVNCSPRNPSGVLWQFTWIPILHARRRSDPETQAISSLGDAKDYRRMSSFLQDICKWRHGDLWFNRTFPPNCLHPAGWRDPNCCRMTHAVRGGKLLTLLLFYVYHLVHTVHKGGYLNRNIVRQFRPAYWQYFPKAYFLWIGSAKPLHYW